MDVKYKVQSGDSTKNFTVKYLLHEEDDTSTQVAARVNNLRTQVLSTLTDATFVQQTAISELDVPVA